MSSISVSSDYCVVGSEGGQLEGITCRPALSSPLNPLRFHPGPPVWEPAVAHVPGRLIVIFRALARGIEIAERQCCSVSIRQGGIFLKVPQAENHRPFDDCSVCHDYWIG